MTNCPDSVFVPTFVRLFLFSSRWKTHLVAIAVVFVHLFVTMETGVRDIHGVPRGQRSQTDVSVKKTDLETI